MEIRITHREDHPRAGFGGQVRFQDPAMPVLQLSAPTLAGGQLLLEHVLEPEFEEPRHTTASLRRKNKEEQGAFLPCYHQT